MNNDCNMPSLLNCIRTPFEKKRPEPTEAELTAELELETPAAAWFTPEAGWPRTSYASPPQLLPTEDEEPALFQLPPPIGELRVEVLEAEGMRVSDILSANDVFAIIVFEGNAAVTSTLEDADRPRWFPDKHARAFKFNARKPHSRMYVALFDEDSFDDDDPLGRVEIPLASLYPDTVYDVWAPLQNSPFTMHMHKYGRVRLRFSISWHSPASRVLQYPSLLTGDPSPDLLPLNSRRWLMAALFATQGPPLDKSFKWSVCRARINEAVEVFSLVTMAKKAAISLICYRYG